jgi:carbamoyl-phosphate synthase large subunit
MPKRDDISSILLIGSGPIIIGQACEFDYSGTQACRALREEGYRVILVNSNPATIMTDPDVADGTYIEPITAEWVERVIVKEKPDAILPTMGGQTALNVALELHDNGALARHGVELIGADTRAIRMAEDREQFAEAMSRIGLEVPHGGFAHTVDEAVAIVEETGFPAIIRPSFTLGGTGGGIAWNREEFEAKVRHGLDLSPITEVLIDRSVIGWKEFELEVMRDGADNVVIVCSIENFDAMGVHTGDSITVAPAMTLSDHEYQEMRNAAIAIIREIGVEAGGCNVQFALSPTDGELLVIEMNPRVSRSSALASKATGFPIARIGAKLAVGYRLDEIDNAITLRTPSCFEPVLDYVVVKIPRFAFEKFPQADATLGVQMKAVGEVMAIGRTFSQAWLKGFRALENDRPGWVPADDLAGDRLPDEALESLKSAIRTPTPERPFQLYRAFLASIPVEELAERSHIDPWFLDQLLQISEAAREFAELPEIGAAELLAAKRTGFGDAELARLRGIAEDDIRSLRHEHGIRPVFKTVDTCAGEFPAATPYLYSTYETENESVRSDRRKMVILGSGRLLFPGPARRRGRDDHDQLESRNGVHRLRHFGQAVLRAADSGGCARDRRAREARGRHRADGRSDPAAARPPSPGSGCAHPRNERGRHRPGGRPKAVRSPVQGVGDHLPRGWYRHECGRGRGSGQPDRLSDPRAPELRARRPGNGDRVRPGEVGGVLCGRRAGGA